jgi:hypothetical protein
MAVEYDNCTLLINEIHSTFTKSYAKLVVSNYMVEPLPSMATIQIYDADKKYTDVLWFSNTKYVKNTDVYYMKSLITHVISVNTRDKNYVGDYLELVSILYNDFNQMIELVRIPSEADIREIMISYNKIKNKSIDLINSIYYTLDISRD